MVGKIFSQIMFPWICELALGRGACQHPEEHMTLDLAAPRGWASPAPGPWDPGFYLLPPCPQAAARGQVQTEPFVGFSQVGVFAKQTQPSPRGAGSSGGECVIPPRGGWWPCAVGAEIRGGRAPGGRPGTGAERNLTVGEVRLASLSADGRCLFRDEGRSALNMQGA